MSAHVHRLQAGRSVDQAALPPLAEANAIHRGGRCVAQSGEMICRMGAGPDSRRGGRFRLPRKTGKGGDLGCVGKLAFCRRQDSAILIAYLRLSSLTGDVGLFCFGFVSLQRLAYGALSA